MPRVSKKSAKTVKLTRRNQRNAACKNGENHVRANDNDDNENLGSYPFSLNNDAIKHGKEFDKLCGSIISKLCISCNKCYPDITVINGFCNDCRRPKTAKAFTAENNVDPGLVPNELCGLTYIEEMLIAQIHPVVSLYRIRGGQYKYSGNVINFKQNINEYITHLPHDPSKLPSTIIFNKETPVGLAKFRVRSQKIRDALLWLKENNMYYKCISINENVMEALPKDGDVSHLLTSLNIDDTNDNTDDELYESNVPQVETIDQQKIIADTLNLDYPTLCGNPINEFNSEGYIAKAFPTLFPTGRGDFLQPREYTITRDSYFKYLMQYKDRRFSNDPRFRFLCMNTLLRHYALQYSGVFINRSKLQNINIAELRSLIESDKSLLYQIMVYCSKLRSTKAYWRQRCSELLKMVDQIGKPTFFFTLSAADYHWPDLFKLICPDREYSSLSENEKRILMHDNPLLVGYFFQKRAQLFLTSVLKPLFNVKDFWLRFEWQARGSPHVHGLLWLEDAPIFNENNYTAEDLDLIKKYFDKYCFAVLYSDEINYQHPSQRKFININVEHYANDLSNLLTRLQRHTECGAHCLRFKKGTTTLQCRYKFPKDLTDSSCIEESGGYLNYVPIRNDCLLQKYNYIVTMLWRANTDFSPIVSYNSVLNYIAKYASKEEVTSFQYLDVLKKFCANYDNESPAKTVISKLIMATVGERDYSAQEVMHILMGWPLYKCSRVFVTIVIKDDIWDKVTNANDDLESHGKSLIEKYSERPKMLKDISLYTFAIKYNCTRKRDHNYPKRIIEAVARVFPIIKYTGIDAEDEKYFRQQCILHIPFFNDYNMLIDDNECLSWKELFLRNGLLMPCDLELPNLEEEDSAPQSCSDYERRDLFEVASALRGELDEDNLGDRLIDKAWDWNVDGDLNCNYDDVNDFLKTYRMNFNATPTLESDTINFSTDQLNVLNVIDNQLKCMRDMDGSRNTNVSNLKRVIVLGKAGSGKSTVIKEIVKRIVLQMGEEAVEIAAPTGVAAINIDGKTIHSLLKLNSKKFQPLTGETSRKFQLDLKKLKFIVFDEMSMIGATLLYQIEQRCREINPEVNEAFGGLNVYFFGDYRQLPPVLDAPLYSANFRKPETVLGSAVINSFERVFSLTNNHRQRNSEMNFPELLDRLGNGSITEDDYNMLSDRREAVLDQDEIKQFQNAINLLPTNALVKEKNEEFLKFSKLPVAKIESVNKPNLASSATTDLAMGLQSILHLAIGCRVMLKCNLWVSGGLVNGSLGTVKGIVYGLGCKPPELPLYILVEFDRFNGPYVAQNYFPIVPVSRSWSVGGINCTRKQFPLSLAHAITIHKSQGLTLNKVIIDIGNKETTVGLTYVALSRVRKLNDLMFSKFYSKQRFDNISRSDAFANRTKFLEKLLAK